VFGALRHTVRSPASMFGAPKDPGRSPECKMKYLTLNNINPCQYNYKSFKIF
jgi:hypothetical protein